jgi:hypothetical protein
MKHTFIFKKDTHGNCGQHNTITESLLVGDSFIPCFKIANSELKDESCHSRKNKHYDQTYTIDVEVGDIIRRSETSASSRNSYASTTCYMIDKDNNRMQIPHDTKKILMEGKLHIYIVVQGKEILTWKQP